MKNHQPSQPDYLGLAAGVSAGNMCQLEVLRNRQDVLVCRVRTPWNESVITKMWNRPDLKGKCRRLTGTSPLAREYRTLLYMARLDTDSPRPLGSFRLRGENIRHTEALVVSDLGRCENAAAVFKSALSSEHQAAVERFEDKIVTITRNLLAGRFVDMDHRITNFVVPPLTPPIQPHPHHPHHGSPVRIDFEHSVRVISLGMVPGMLGRMLGTLIGSHVYLTQPETVHSEAFTQRLLDSIGPMVSRRALRAAQGTVDNMLDGQAQRHGIVTKFRIGY